MASCLRCSGVSWGKNGINFFSLENFLIGVVVVKTCFLDHGVLLLDGFDGFIGDELDSCEEYNSTLMTHSSSLLRCFKYPSNVGRLLPSSFRYK